MRDSFVYLQSMAEYPLSVNNKGAARSYILNEWTNCLLHYAVDHFDLKTHARGNASTHAVHMQWIIEQWPHMDTEQKKRSSAYFLIVYGLLSNVPRQTDNSKKMGLPIKNWVDEHIHEVIDYSVGSYSFLFLCEHIGSILTAIGSQGTNRFFNKWTDTHPVDGIASDEKMHTFFSNLSDELSRSKTSNRYTSMLMHFQFITKHLIRSGQSNYMLDLNNVILQQSIIHKIPAIAGMAWPVCGDASSLDWSILPSGWMLQKFNSKDTNKDLNSFVSSLIDTYLYRDIPYHLINWKPLEGVLSSIQHYTVDELQANNVMGIYLYSRMMLEDDWHIQSPELLSLCLRYLDAQLQYTSKLEDSDVAVLHTVWTYLDDEHKKQYAPKALIHMSRSQDPGCLVRHDDLYLPYLTQLSPKKYTPRDRQYVLQIWNRHTVGESLADSERKLLTHFSKQIFETSKQDALLRFNNFHRHDPSFIDMLSAWKEPWTAWVVNEILPELLSMVHADGLREGTSNLIVRALDSIEIEIPYDLLERYQEYSHQDRCDAMNNLEILLLVLGDETLSSQMHLVRSLFTDMSTVEYYQRLSALCVSNLQNPVGPQIDLELDLFQG